MRMFELATDFSKRTVYQDFLDIDPSWDYEESQKQATRYIKTLICRNIEIPNHEPIVRDGLEWKITPAVIKQILHIINNIDVRHWERITYTSLRNVGVYSWEETPYGEYHITLLKKCDISDDERILFSYLYISIYYTNSMSILCGITNRFTKEYKSKEFNNPDDFIECYNNITKNNGDI